MKSDLFMETLQKKTSLTPEGKKCLTKYFDPFHDTLADVSPMPDGNTRPVIVQEVRSSLAIASGGKDVVINIMPFNYCHTGSTPLVPARRVVATYGQNAPIPGFANAAGVTEIMAMSYEAETTSIGFQPGVVDVQLVDPGSLYFPDGKSVYTSANVTRLSVPNAAPYSSGARRLVYVAMELHNTTAEIYKQGTITCYRKPVAYTSMNMRCGHAVATNLNAPAPDSQFGVGVPTSFVSGGAPYTTIADLPPASVGAAMAYVGTTQWDAAKGAYAVGTMLDCTKNPMSQNQWGATGMQAGDGNTVLPASVMYLPTVYADYMGVATMRRDNVSSNAPPYYTFGEYRQLPYLRSNFANSGIICSGLSTNSTFTLTFKFGWEYSPSVVDPTVEQLVWLTRPPPPVDQSFIELYQMVARQLPPAVPVTENPGGEWFETVVGLVKEAIPLITSLLPLGSMAPAIGAMARGALDSLSPQGQWGAPKVPKLRIRAKTKAKPKSRSSSASSVSRKNVKFRNTPRAKRGRTRSR